MEKEEIYMPEEDWSPCIKCGGPKDSGLQELCLNCFVEQDIKRRKKWKKNLKL